MNNQVKGLLYYYWIDGFRTLKIFFTILIGTLLATATIAYLLRGVDGFKMYFALPFATYVNAGIVAFQLIKGCVPFGLKLGALRKNIYRMQFYFILIYSVVLAVLSSTLQVVIEGLLKVFGITNFIFGHPAMALTDSWSMRIAVDTLLMFFIMALLYLIALIFYRTGLVGGGSLLGLLAVVMLHGVFEGWMIRALTNIFTNMTMMTFVTIFVIGIILYLIGFLFMRRITIVKTR